MSYIFGASISKTINQNSGHLQNVAKYLQISKSSSVTAGKYNVSHTFAQSWVHSRLRTGWLGYGHTPHLWGLSSPCRTPLRLLWVLQVPPPTNTHPMAWEAPSPSLQPGVNCCPGTVQPSALAHLLSFRSLLLIPCLLLDLADCCCAPLTFPVSRQMLFLMNLGVVLCTHFCACAPVLLVVVIPALAES